MYEISKDTAAESNFKPFSAGIHANAELKSVEFKVVNEKINEGEPTLVFDFVGAKGEKINHIEYPVDNAPDPAKAGGFMASRIKHILSKFIPEDQIVLRGNTYKEFCEGVIALIGDHYKGVKVAIKLTYGDKKYPKTKLGFPKFPDFIALSPLDLHILPTDNMSSTPVAQATPADELDGVGGTVVDDELGANPGDAATDNLPF